MLEIKAYHDGENEIIVEGNCEGRTDNCCVELCHVFDTALRGIAENEKPELAEKLELATVATIVADFIGRKTGMLDNDEFMDGMLGATTSFLHGNILMNSQEGREKIFDLLEELVADNKPEQPEGEVDGAE